MPKALELSLDTMTPPPMPQAAMTKTAPAERKPKYVPKAEPKEPLQVRWPADEIKAVKLAAIQADFPTVSDFMLACFHAYMKDKGRQG
jgi:hypothetical protein